MRSKTTVPSLNDPHGNRYREMVARTDIPTMRAPVVLGFDLSNGAVTHVEWMCLNGVLTITDSYETVDGKTNAKEAV